MFTTAQVVTAVQQDPSGQRQFIGVVTIPDGQVIPTVDLHQTGTIHPPLVNSTILVWVNGSFGAKYICTLVEPANQSSRMNIPVQNQAAMSAGELQMAPASGGASIFMNTNGGIHLTAGTIKDEIVIDNQEISIAASVIDIHRTSDLPTAQPHLGIDNLGFIHLGIQTPGFPSVLLSGFSVNPLTGSLAMSTGPQVTPLGSVSVDIFGVVTLESGVGSGTLAGGIGSVKVFPTGLVKIIAATEVQVTAPVVSVDSGSITLGIAGQKLATESFVKLLYDTHVHTGGTLPGTLTGVPTISSISLPLALTTVTKAL